MGRVVHSEFIDEHEIKLQRHEREIGLGRLELESLALACVVLYRSLCLSHPVIVAPVLHKAPQLIKIWGRGWSKCVFYRFLHFLQRYLLALVTLKILPHESRSSPVPLKLLLLPLQVQKT